jgi:hypothetical protein
VQRHYDLLAGAERGFAHEQRGHHRVTIIYEKPDVLAVEVPEKDEKDAVSGTDRTFTCTQKVTEITQFIVSIFSILSSQRSCMRLFECPAQHKL